MKKIWQSLAKTERNMELDWQALYRVAILTGFSQGMDDKKLQGL